MTPPIALDHEARELLFAIARFPAGRLLQPYQVRVAQKLVAMGLVEMWLSRLQLFVDSHGYHPCEAGLTAAGTRVVDGPALVRRDGQVVDPPVTAPSLTLPQAEGESGETPCTYFTHDSIVDAIVASTDTPDGAA